VATDKLPALAERLAGWVDAGVETEDLVPELVLDAACTPSELDRVTLDELERIGPFGKGNPAPLLTMPGVRPARIGPLGRGPLHLRFEVDGLECVWWRGADHEAALASGPVDLVGRLELNRWKGRERLRFTVEDGRKAQG
jgi:single-stranded-DNA-specific exonuclease